jgi:WD40 repeat protein
MPNVGPNLLPLLRGPDPAQTRQVQEFKYTSPLLSCRFDPLGKYLFFSAQDNTVQRTELASGRLTAFNGAKSWVRALAMHPAGGLLFAGTYDGKILCWPVDAEKPEPVRLLEAHGGWVRALAVSPDGATLASCGNDHLVKLWSTTDGRLIEVLRGHDAHVYNVAFHPTGTALVSADLEGIVKQWNLVGGLPASPSSAVREFDAKVLYKYDEGFRADIGGIRSIAFSADGNLLACGGITDVSNAFAGIGKPAVALFDWQTGQRKQLLRPKEDFQGLVCGLAFHKDGYLIGAGGGNGGALWFWKPDQPQAFFTLKLPANARDLSLHPDGRRLAISFFDNTARIYTMTRKA